jgi:hypothetical protein
MSTMRSVTARYFAAAQNAEAAAREAYESGDVSTAYWLLIDLNASASFRQQAGEFPAFVRNQVLMRLITSIAETSGDLTLFKELGDGALIRSNSLRGGLELLSLIDAIRILWSSDSSTRSDRPSLEFDAAISKGDAVAWSGDFFGAAIDRVARIASLRPSDPNVLCVMENDARSGHEKNMSNEMPYLTVEAPTLAPTSILKSGEQPFLVCAVTIDRAKYGDQTGFFRDVRKASPAIHS